MNTQELIEYCESLKGDLNKFINGINVDKIIAKIEQLDESQPIKLKDVIVRIKKLDIGTQKVWLNEILNELGSDYGTLKYKAGYEQGKVEGEWVGQQLKDADKIRRELNRPVVPQFVADWYEIHKDSFEPDLFACIRDILNDGCVANISDFEHWILGQKDSITTLINMHQVGYEIEKKKRYTVKVKADFGQHLGRYYINDEKLTPQFTDSQLTVKCKLPTFTRKELEQAGFGWVFDCEGIEVEEVE